MEITKLQKKIFLSTFGFVLGGRAARYTYLKYVQDIFTNRDYFSLISFVNELIFVTGLIVFFFSVLGSMSVIREIWVDNDKFIVRERFIRLLINSLWTLVVSAFLALLVKILIWP